VRSGGQYPVWRKDAKTIVFIDWKSHQISTISVSEAGGALRFNSPTALFAVPASAGLFISENPLAVTRDGSRILFPKALTQPEDSNVIHIKSGWLETQH